MGVGREKGQLVGLVVDQDWSRGVFVTRRGQIDGPFCVPLRLSNYMRNRQCIALRSSLNHTSNVFGALGTYTQGRLNDLHVAY